MVRVPSEPSKVTVPLPPCAVTRAGTSTLPSATRVVSGSAGPGRCQNATTVVPFHSPEQTTRNR